MSMAKYCKGYEFEGRFTKRRNHYNIVFDYLEMRSLLKKGKLDKYDVIHINNWFNIPLVKYRKSHQIWIFESHGSHIGLETYKVLEAVPFHRKILTKIMSIFFEKKYQNYMRQYDLYYVAVPSHMPEAKKVRKDATWLPNVINIDFFKPQKKKVKMKGNPAIFMPSRIHGYKDPMFGLKIFNEIKKEYPNAFLHLVEYGDKNPLKIEFLTKLGRKNYVLYDFLDKITYRDYMCSADLILGQYLNGANGLNELEAMACKTPLVSLDTVEVIKVKKDDLPDYAIRLLKNKKFKEKEVNRLHKYVVNTHSAAASAKIYVNNIKKVIKTRKL